MKKKRVSIKDIADALSISVTSVSFILNGKAEEKHISKELTKKVLDYAAAINYRPNQIAQSLRTGKSKILVFMVEDISNSFFANLARSIEDIAYEKGYKVIFCSNENDDDKSNDLIEVFNFRQVDGFIIVPSAGIKETVRQLIDDNIPVVLLDRYFEDLESNVVVIDNEEASYTATKHLIDNKYKNITFITTDTEQTQMLDRLAGYKRAVNEAGLAPEVVFVPFTQAGTEAGKKLITDFVKNAAKPDAVFFATNYLALLGLEVFKNESPQLIDDLGIVTFDDNDLFRIFSPTITAVAQPMWQIGTELMEVMLQLLKKKDVKEDTQKIVLKAELKVRESSTEKRRLK
ncbi:LacI family DNA-binding transcriptional regulator [Flavobacterium sp. DG1-102-2]|uniref:LacI family DNA-binding transcriptional regulator n=1 Tax=Flavobacterium sp. DG1-102-2 TaxID=3081663 RepID=UPI00294A8F63|nr:LacI family DNA-binding transcriptional regulator [Flavobacterium sp. DG1-102-2]MDV6167407.1 LacI family DNA-binding transcriptional regulator [Flavobacterium sp. DG1-102-2]